MAEIKTRPATPEFRDGYDRIFKRTLERSMTPTPGSQTEKDEAAWKYEHVTYPSGRIVRVAPLAAERDAQRNSEAYEQSRSDTWWGRGEMGG